MENNTYLCKRCSICFWWDSDFGCANKHRTLTTTYFCYGFDNKTNVEKILNDNSDEKG